MSRATRWATRFFALALIGASASASAGGEPQAGETRVVFSSSGVVLRAEPSGTAAPVGSLPKHTRVVVLEVKSPYIKVEGAPGAGKPSISGWIRGSQSVDPALLAAPAPPIDARPGTGGVSERDAMAAGRRLDAETERGYRAQRQDLARGYELVDAMELATARMDPAESVEFMYEGAVGVTSNDLQLPARLPAPPAPPAKERSRVPDGLKEKAGDLLGGLLGGKKAGKVAGKLLVAFADAAVESRVEQLGSKFTIEQDYYLGRAVAANAFAQHGAEPNASLRRYVRRVGDAIVRASPRIEPNYGGYHFDVLATDDVNGISGPGGYVLLTRGAVLACQTEDELAALLAHELSHVVGHHSEEVIRAGERAKRRHEKLVKVASVAASATDVPFLSGLVEYFGDASEEMHRVAREHAYGSRLEFFADQGGAYILQESWYDWRALSGYLARLGHSGHLHGGVDHASPQQRVAALEQHLQPLGMFNPKEWVRPERKRRLDEALGRAPPAPPAPPPALPPEPAGGPAPAGGGFPPPQPGPAAPPAGAPPAWPPPR